jgi:hypothetical protein
MGFLDLLSWAFRSAAGEDDSLDVTDRHRRLSAAARSDRVTPELLTESGDRTSEPLDVYVEESEQPQYVLQGSELIVEDQEESLARNYPTRLLVVLVSDERFLFVVGGRLSDDLYEVPLADLQSAYVDEKETQRHVIVEANRDDDHMTFYADVSLTPVSDVEGSLEYVRGRS